MTDIEQLKVELNEAYALIRKYELDETTQDIEIIKLRSQVADQQYKIDMLMWEYCPEEMTNEQIENFEKHQVPYNE